MLLRVLSFQAENEETQKKDDQVKRSASESAKAQTKWEHTPHVCAVIHDGLAGAFGPLTLPSPRYFLYPECLITRIAVR